MRETITISIPDVLKEEVDKIVRAEGISIGNTGVSR